MSAAGENVVSCRHHRRTALELCRRHVIRHVAKDIVCLPFGASGLHGRQATFPAMMPVKIFRTPPQTCSSALFSEAITKPRRNNFTVPLSAVSDTYRLLSDSYSDHCTAPSFANFFHYFGKMDGTNKSSGRPRGAKNYKNEVLINIRLVNLKGHID